MIGCNDLVVEVVEFCGVGDLGVDGVGWGIVVGVENGCVGLFLWWFILLEDYVFLLLVKSMIVWVCNYRFWSV